MCGLFGVTGTDETVIPRAQKALDVLAHRGPDGGSHMLVDSVFIGHRRLSIIDLSDKGTQPMEAEGVYLTVNGEIYNYKNLRTELTDQHGIMFASDSDSEVMLHGYRIWGLDELLRRADGMFAMALYDSHRKQVVLARDHVGIKPLYYALKDEGLAWASELAPMVAFYGEDNLTVDPTALYDFLTYLYVPSPKSLYRDIYKLEPGHVAVFDIEAATLEKRRYWSLEVARDVTNEHEAIDMVRRAIGRSVSDQLMSDVPLGAFLSGGTDSSIVCHEAMQRLEKLTTCSIGFDDPAMDESRYANAVAERLGAHHIVRTVDRDYVRTNTKKLRQWFGEPFADTSAFPTYEVAKLAREHMTVVLTGDGGDELFGGYNHYCDWYQSLVVWVGFLFFLRPVITWLKHHGPARVRRIARKVEIFAILDPLERRVRLSGGLTRGDAAKNAWRKALGIADDYDDYWFFRLHYRKDLPRRSRAMYLDFFTSLPEDMLTKVDRTSMAVALEARVPLLSKDVIETAWRLSEDVLFAGGVQKGLLKKAYAADLPQDCLYRRKQGFSIGAPTIRAVFDTAGRSLPEAILDKLFGDSIARAAKGKKGA